MDARSQQVVMRRTMPCNVILFRSSSANRAVLTGDPGNQRDFAGIVHTSRVSLATFALFPARVFKRIHRDEGFHHGAAIK